VSLFGVVNAAPHNLLVTWILQKELVRAARTHLTGRLIDIGCATKPYAELLAPYVSEHVGVDHAGTRHARDAIDLSGDAYDIPARDGSFDSAVCTAVLEHLEEPELALRECHRVLAPGGVAIYSVPFIWHLHEEPRDFYRFSKYGLRHLFEKIGFEILELTPLSGFWITFGQLLCYKLQRFHRGAMRWIPVIPALTLLIQGLAYAADRVDRAEAWTWMYLVVARKTRRPAAAGPARVTPSAAADGE